MGMHTPVHRCSDRECPNFEGITTSSCGCHKTAKQMLTEQRDDLLESLRSLLEIHAAHHNNPVHAAARSLIAKAEGRS